MSELSTAAGSPPSTLQERVESLRLNKEIRVPPRRGAKVFWIIILAIFLGTGYWAYKNYGDQIRNALTSSTAPLATSTAPMPSAAEKEKIATNIAQEAGGYIVPKQRVQVSPKVGGLVKELFIEEGKYVEAGQPIAKLEVEEYLFEYRRAAAYAELGRAKYDEALKGNRDEEKLQAAAAEK